MSIPFELWAVIVDVVISAILYFGAKYLTPSIFEDVKFGVGLLQPLVMAIITYAFGKKVQVQVRALVAQIRALR